MCYQFPVKEDFAIFEVHGIVFKKKKQNAGDLKSQEKLFGSTRCKRRETGCVLQRRRLEENLQ